MGPSKLTDKELVGGWKIGFEKSEPSDDVDEKEKEK